MSFSATTYALSKKYTNDTAEEFGAVKGANCQIKSIVKANNRNTVTFLWKNSQDVEQESVMIVEDGTPIYEWHSGDSYEYGDLCIYASCFYRCTTPNHDVEFDSDKWSEIGSPDGNYDIVQTSSMLPPIFTAADRKMYYSIEDECFWLWNGSAWVKQRTLSQYSTMPAAGASYVGRIVQYIGATNVNYTEGYYYKCTVTGEVGSEVYSWEQINIQPPSSTTFIGTTAEWGNLTPAEQAEYELVDFTNDTTNPSVVVDVVADGNMNPVTSNAVYDALQGSGGSLTRTLNVTCAAGGIKVGDTYTSGYSIEDLFHDMLDPVAYPTLTDPSVTISAPGSKLLETGAQQSVTITATFNRGSINPAYGTSGYRSGAATGYSMNGGESQAENTFTVTVDSTAKTYQATVTYAEGEQPKDSTGADYNTPLAAGSVTSNTITYDFVDAMWANTSNISTVAKLSLIAKSTKQRDMIFPAQTASNPEIFDMPASWTVTAVQVKNDLSGAYEDASSQFTVTDVTHDDASGTSVAYKRYTFNMGVDTGARTIRVKWS